MTLSEQVKKNIEAITELYEFSDRVVPRKEKKDCFIQSQLSLIDNMLERLEKSKKEREVTRITPTHHLGFDISIPHNKALQDQIDYLLEERSKIEKI